jgi:hypothetical protein
MARSGGASGGRTRWPKAGWTALAIVAVVALSSFAVTSAARGLASDHKSAPSPAGQPTGAAELTAAKLSLATAAAQRAADGITVAPQNREYTAMAWDPANQEVILFGGATFLGINGNLNISNRTWAFVNGSWTQLHPANSPPPTFQAGFAYDAGAGALVLFGGLVAGHVNVTHPSTDNGTTVTVWHTAYDWNTAVVQSAQTWEWVGDDWVNVTVAGSPSARTVPAMAADPFDDGVVLFGGERENASAAATEYAYSGGNSWYWNFSARALYTVADTWTFEDGAWTNLTARVGASPPSRGDAAFAEGPSGSAVLFGGVSGGCAAYSYPGVCGWGILGDTWVFSGSTWTPAATTGPSPAPSYGAMLANVSNAGGLILFGGAINSATYNATWAFSGNSWVELRPYAQPPWTDDGGFADDPAAGYAVLTIGYTGGDLYPSFGTTWEFADGNWSLPGTNLSLPPPGPASMTYDPSDQAVVLVSPGYPGVVVPSEETWTFADGGWTELNTSGSPPAGGNITYDPNGSYLLYAGEDVYGGCSSDAGTWELLGTAWTEVTTQTLCNPAPMAYDPVSGEVVSFDGELTVVWNGTAWQSLSLSVLPPTDPPVPGNHAMAYDPLTRQLLFVLPYYTSTCAPNGSSGHGGNNSSGNGTSGCEPTSSDGTYLWAFANSSWTNLSSQSQLTPPVLATASIAWDSADNELVMFGGVCGWPSCTTPTLENETWVWAGGQWSEVNGAVAPSPRDEAGMAYDTADGFVVLYGGDCGSCLAPLSDTWDFVGGNWTQLAPALRSTYSQLDVGVSTVLTAITEPGLSGVTYTYEGLPPGCDSQNTSTLTCIPTGPGHYHVTVALPAELGAAAATTRLEVASLPSVVTFTASRTLVPAGQATTLAVSVSGGTGPLAFQYLDLPPGCSSRDTIVLACTPTTPGNYTVNVVVSDAFGRTATGKLALVVVVGIVGPGGSGGLQLLAGLLSPYGLAEMLAGPAIVVALAVGFGARAARLRREGDAIVQELRRAPAELNESPKNLP